MGKAYVDHQTPEEIKRSREIAKECSVSENKIKEILE